MPEPPRVLLVTADMGAGHTEVAAELARRLRLAGAHAETVELLSAAGRAGYLMRDTYRTVLRRAPWLYGGAMTAWRHCPPALQRVFAAGTGPFERALRAAARAARPDVVVSTYNLASLSLGRLAERGQLGAPVATYVSDPGAHPYWVSHGVELHFAATSPTAAALARYGARRVVVVAPVLRPEFAAPPPRAEARARLGLPADACLAVLNAGSWAAGDVEGTLDIVSRERGVTPVVLCGRDEALRARVAARPGAWAVPWTGDMAGYLAAADVVVDNAGGQTCWEALACAVPVLVFRPLPGHGKLNAAALEQAGLARYVRSAAALGPALRAACAGGRHVPVRSPFSGDDAVPHILALAGSGARHVAA